MQFAHIFPCLIMDVIALVHSVRDVGSRVPCSKRRATWSFIIRGRQHELVLVHSPSSPSKPTCKLLLSVDGHELIESRESRSNHTSVSTKEDEVWRHAFDLSGHPLLVRVMCVSMGPLVSTPGPEGGLWPNDSVEHRRATSAAENAPPAQFTYRLSIGGEPFEKLAGAHGIHGTHGAHGEHGAASGSSPAPGPSTWGSAAIPSLATSPAGAVPEMLSQSHPGNSSVADASGAAPAQVVPPTAGLELLASAELERDRAALRRFHQSLLSLGVRLPDLPDWVNCTEIPSTSLQGDAQAQGHVPAASSSARPANANGGSVDDDPSLCSDHHPWQLQHDEHGNQYFFNPETRESRWELPPLVAVLPVSAAAAETFC